MPVAEDVRALEAVPQHQLLVREQRDGWPLGDELAMVEDEDAGAQLDDQLEVVGGNERCDWDLPQQGDQVAAAARIEAARWLVENED